MFSQPLSDLSSVFCYVPLSPESPRPDYPIYSELVLLLRAKGVECNVWVFPFLCKLPFSIQPVLTSGLVRMVLRVCVLCVLCFCVCVSVPFFVRWNELFALLAGLCLGGFWAVILKRPCGATSFLGGGRRLHKILRSGDLEIWEREI